MPLSPLTSRVPRLAAFALAIVLAGCARPEAGGNAGPTGGTLVIVATGDADVLFPPSGAVTTSADVAGLVFSRLADLTFDLNTVDDAGFTPELARSWDHADSTTLVFHLDPRARWHDGVPVRAADVAFTFGVYRDTLVNSRFRPDLDAIDSVTVRDSLTAIFHFHRWYPEQLYDATYHMKVLPRHLLDTIPPARLGSSAFARAPVGSGPFRFVRWDAGATIEVAADTAYFLGRPMLDRVIWRIVPDLAAGVSTLAAGEGDAIQVIPQAELRAQYETIARHMTGLMSISDHDGNSLRGDFQSQFNQLNQWFDGLMARAPPPAHQGPCAPDQVRASTFRRLQQRHATATTASQEVPF